MKTIVINVPDKDESWFVSLFEKLKLKTHVLTEEEKEDISMAEWIDEGMKSGEVSKETIFATMRKNGVKI